MFHSEILIRESKNPFQVFIEPITVLNCESKVGYGRKKHQN